MEENLKPVKENEEENEIKVELHNDDLDDFDDFYDKEYDVNGECHCGDCECEEGCQGGCECHCSDCDCGDDCQCDCECHCDDCDCGDDCQCDCHCSCGCHDYSEEYLPESLMDDFDSKIVERGEEYYDSGNVLSICKDGNHYYGRVEGHSHNIYDIDIYIHNQCDADYECTCPCEYPCKHAYAMLLAISENQYEEVNLKDCVLANIDSLQELIEKIPADELKSYLLSNKGLQDTCFDYCAFTEYFRKYLSKQSYEYYYNNLYNAIILRKNYFNKINEYLDCARDYLNNHIYSEVLKIMKAIVEAWHDCKDKLDNDDLDIMSKMGMLLRIVYRKADNELKTEINNWKQELKDHNYYDNYYLEDIILLLKD